MITIEIDEQEYSVPSDGRVDEEMEDYTRELFYDINGVSVKQVKVLMES